MKTFRFTEHVVEDRAWEVEAASLKDAVAEYHARRYDHDDPDEVDVQCSDLVEVAEDKPLDLDIINKMLADLDNK